MCRLHLNVLIIWLLCLTSKIVKDQNVHNQVCHFLQLLEINAEIDMLFLHEANLIVPLRLNLYIDIVRGTKLHFLENKLQEWFQVKALTPQYTQHCKLDTYIISECQLSMFVVSPCLCFITTCTSYVNLNT